MKTYIFLITVFCFVIGLTKAQENQAETKYEVKGTLIDQNTNEPLIAAAVYYDKGKGTRSNEKGEFTLLLPNNTYTLTLMYLGYTTQTTVIQVNGSNMSVPQFSMLATTELNEVEIVADVAKSRETPIAFSDVTAKQITREMGANDFTMLMNSTPGAYATQQGGGAGDSRVNIRGFDQRYIGVLVDGVPVNDMENGRVFWSNWAGLAEVTQKIQVQRGLGASRLALPAVGGVMNVITNSIDQKRMLIVRNDMGTANYQRLSIGYNSGLIKNKFGFTLAGSYAGGDGYIDATWQKTWSYFAKFTYKINSKNLIVLGFNGAPQSHGQRSFAINMAYHDRKYAEQLGVNVDSVYASNKYTSSTIGARGTTYSPDWGYLNGHAQAVKVNYFHKPLANLTYVFNPNARFSFSNVLYYSMGNGGGTSLNSFPADIYDVKSTGQLQLQTLYDANVATKPGTVVPGQSAAGYYIYAAINKHKWVGTISTVKYKILSNLEFLGGFDARYYLGTHYQTPFNLLGGNYVDAPAGKDLNLAPRNKDPMSYVKNIGDKINYYNDSKISWLGLFGQVEHKINRLTTFITVTGNQSGYQYINYFGKKDIVFDKNNIVHNAVGYGDTLYTDGSNYGVPQFGTLKRNTDGSLYFKDNLTKTYVTIQKDYLTYSNTSPQARTNTSAISYFKGYTGKGGLNYQLDKNNNVFANFGYMNLVPKFNNVFDNNGNKLSDIRNQLIISEEFGYSFKQKYFAANVNVYNTKWGNKPADFISSYTDPVSGQTIYYNPTGIDAVLKGVEFDFAYNIFKSLELRAFGMTADWKWDSRGTTYVYAADGTQLQTIDFDAKGVAIGNAPQRQIGGSLKYEPIKNTYVKLQYIYFDKMYAQFDPANLKVDGTGASAKDYRGYSSWKAPAYGIYDLYLGYHISGKNANLDIFGTMNNILNTVYMTDVFFPTGVTPNNYNATNTVGWFGLGRRINIGLKVTL